MRGVRHGRRSAGFTTLEALVAVFLIVLVVVFTGRVIVTTIALIGRGNTADQHGARVRSQATVWIQAVTEYTRKVGFDELSAPATCPTVPCEFRMPAVSVPYAGAPALPRGFRCGILRLSDWDGAGPVAPTELRLMTVEIYEADCAVVTPTTTPFMAAHSGIARR